MSLFVKWCGGMQLHPSCLLRKSEVYNNQSFFSWQLIVVLNTHTHTHMHVRTHTHTHTHTSKYHLRYHHAHINFLIPWEEKPRKQSSSQTISPASPVWWTRHNAKEAHTEHQHPHSKYLCCSSVDTSTHWHYGKWNSRSARKRRKGKGATPITSVLQRS